MTASAPTASRRYMLLVGALVVVVLVALGLGGKSLWHRHQQSQQRHAYSQAEQALTKYVLPAGLTPGADPECVARLGALCASTPMTGQAVNDLVMTALHVDYPCPVDRYGCPPIFGTIAGYPATATVVEHLLHVTTGTPPPNATPVGPRRNHMFIVGSYVEITLDAPGDRSI